MFNRRFLNGMNMTVGELSMLVHKLAMHITEFCMRLRGVEPFCIRPGYSLTSTRLVG